MPEGHVAHRLARQQAELVGHVLGVCSPQGRFADGAARLDARRLDGVVARGKHLLHAFDGDVTLHTHLGMRGLWLRLPAGAAPKPQVRVRLAGEAASWDLIAPAGCEVLDVAGVERLVAGLGPDPLDPDVDDDEAVRRLRGSRAPVGVALMDQAVVAGVGNVVRAEALHEARVDPRRPAAELGEDEAWTVWRAASRLLRDAEAVGRIAVDAEGHEARRVYEQKRCADCGGPVEAVPLAGRRAWTCPRCQAA